MTYEFRSRRYRILSDMCDEIADKWLAAVAEDGWYSKRGVLADFDDGYLACWAIGEWDLSRAWPDARGFPLADLIAAFGRRRAKIERWDALTTAILRRILLILGLAAAWFAGACAVVMAVSVFGLMIFSELLFLTGK